MRASARFVFILVSVAFASAGCSSSSEPVRAEAPLPPQTAADIVGASEKLTVVGRIEPISVDAVDGLGIDNGRLLVRGSSGTVAIDVPGGASPDKPVRTWALTTEGAGDPGRRFTFVHNETLADFSIDLPPSEAPLRFGVLEGPSGDVMIFAWGEQSRSYWGYVTITRKTE